MNNRETMKYDLKNEIAKYHPDADLSIVDKAFDLAYDMHSGQKRNSGEDYIIHPYNVAMILAGLNMDVPTIISGLLHDVVEDTETSLEFIDKEYGDDVANIVDGVTKLTKIKYQSKLEKQAENIRKMVLSMAKDIRVIIVKLADRLHNMRTLEYMTEEKKKEKATEVIEIYAPLANRLGMSKIKWELEDLALRYLDEKGFYELVDKVNRRRIERDDLINSIIHTLEENLSNANIEASISGRPKNFYSIYKKMHMQGKTFDEIYDLSAVRILVNDLSDCYGALGVVHTLWKPIPGRFKDYIAVPKPNMYQSLHTTVIDNNGEIFEVQIRTYDMHRVAEYGIAAHWKYKEGTTDRASSRDDDNMTWLRQMLEWQKEQTDPSEFMEGLKVDFFTDEVFVFTPRGDVINLAEGSTPIDFAYRVHSQVGNTCVGAKVNGRIVPLNYTLRNGNIIEIITNPNSTPSLDWLKIVKSQQAKNKIRQYFKVKDKDKNTELGKEMLERELKRLNYRPSSLLKEEWLMPLAQKYRNNSIDDLYAGVGYGTLTVNQIVGKLVEAYNKENKPTDEAILEDAKSLPTKKHTRRNDQGVMVKGADNIKVRMAKCCTPVPGDKIIGYVTMGRGVSVHRADCINIINEVDKNRLLEVEWDQRENVSYSAQVSIKAIDRAGLLADITNRISDSKISLSALNASTNREKISTVNIVLEIHDIEELNRLMERFRRIKNVIEVYRVTS